MSTDRDRPLTRRSASHLLDQPGAAGDRVGQILRAASAPAQTSELAGEEAAAAMFRAVRQFRAPVPESSPVIKTSVGRLFIARLLTAGAVAVAATGGIALAATTGTLPDPLRHPHPGATPASTAHHPTHARSGSAQPADSDEPSTAPNPTTPSGIRSGTTGSKTATPAPSLVGLCRAFQSHAASNPGHALDNPAFSALVADAGGPSRVNAFCIALIGTPTNRHPSGPAPSDSGGHPSAHPGAPTSRHPSGPHPGRPAGAAPSHLTGPKSGHPAAPPSSRQSGPPTGR